ncbi:MAG: hypothetical protein WC026_15600 [Hyphomicrobium sp.]|uniref:hypothetical protein n=1 Tax=Hyphomicrobium sp. TaxID=82 RepID=UPI0035678B96
MATKRQRHIARAFDDRWDEYGDGRSTEWLILMTADVCNTTYSEVVDALAAVDADRKKGELKMSALNEIATEFRRQREDEGWTAEHDDGHVNGELAQAASCYASTDTDTVLWRKRHKLSHGSPPSKTERRWLGAARLFGAAHCALSMFLALLLLCNYAQAGIIKANQHLWDIAILRSDEHGSARSLLDYAINKGRLADGGANSIFGGFGGSDRRLCSDDSRAEGEHESRETKDAEQNLRSIEGPGITLFAQISLVVICGIGAIWITPIGLLLFVFADAWPFAHDYGESDHAKRRKRGVVMLIIGLISFAGLAFALSL